MSMNDLFGLAGSKPKLITAYTSGTGTYVPTVDMARCFVRVQAGGAGGHATGSGGGGGAMIEFWMRVPIAGVAYAVAASAAAATQGNTSTFGQFTAMGGFYDGSGLNIAMYGGVVSIMIGMVDADSASLIGGDGMTGVPGGSGGNGATPGLVAGFPTQNSTLAVGGMTSIAQRAGNGQGNNSGGNSFYGKGGTSGNAPAATAYGAGGGMNAASRGGYIEVWDFGA